MAAGARKEGKQILKLQKIYEDKRRKYTLVTLGAAFCLVFIVTVLAFLQGVVIRQVVNSLVLVIIGICTLVLYRSQKPILWVTYVAVIFIHLISTSGFITNGGVVGYGIAVFPVVPVVTALLLGRKIALYSLAYMLILGLFSGLLILYGNHPGNITPTAYIPYLAIAFSVIALIAAFVAFYSLLLTTEQFEVQIGDYTKQLEDEIGHRAIAEAKAREAEKAKSNFLSVLSHELRTPLNGIVGFNSILSRQELTEKGQVCVKNIRESSDLLLCKISDLLEFSDLFSAKVTINKSLMVLEDIFTALQHELAPIADKNGISLSFEIGAISATKVETDSAKLQKILYNLIDNALKFTKDGEVVIRARFGAQEQVAAAEPGEAILVCEVQDSGVGVSEESIATLFDMFIQQDMSAQRSFEGIGLGLATCYQYALLLGGNLSVKNNLGKGCTFKVEIPVTCVAC